MQSRILQQHLNAYRRWKTRVARSVRELEGWLGVEGQLTSENQERLRNALEVLRDNRMCIALVGETARGKAELINAIFFTDYRRRLLPTAAGDSAQCPTELLWDDERDQAYLRLLPIETRSGDSSISELKKDASQWVHYPLNVQDSRQMASTIGEIRKTKQVSIGEARQLGLLSARGVAAADPLTRNRIEVPKWRYAVISFPHALFKLGLSVLLVPGLNALDSEPELTSNSILAAQALLFVVAGDDGTTARDLELWQNHLKGLQTPHGVTVALTKSDILWDHPQDPDEKETEIMRQRADAAKSLAIDEAIVLPVSAQKGFQARLNQDEVLFRKSALGALERRISSMMLEAKRRNLVDMLDRDVGRLLAGNRSRIGERIQHIKGQLAELEDMREKSDQVIRHLLEKTRLEQDTYLQSVQKFQASREELLSATESSRRTMDKDAIEQLIEENVQEMAKSRTTVGLSAAMNQLFEELRRAIWTIAQESVNIRKTVHEIYESFDAEFDLNLAPPEVFVPTKIRVDIELVYKDVEAFRRSSGMTLRRKQSVIRHYQRKMVNRANEIFDQLRSDFERSMEEALQPLADRIQEDKRKIEKRLDDLKRISGSKDRLRDRMKDTQKQYVELAKQLTALRNINNSLNYNPLHDGKRKGKPHLVARNS